MNSPYKRCSLFSFILASGLFTGAFAADRKIVFALSSDQHYGIPSYTNNPAVVQGIWNLPLVWTNWGPAWTNQTLDNLRGIVCLGDVVNHPHPSYWNLYSQVYTDMRDGGQMPCTVYDGYGNHDLGSSIWTNMAARNAQLKNVRLSPNNACYSWDWQDVHFIQLNLYPGTNADCRGSYAFLTNDLATCVGKTGRPVVLFHHYGFSPNLLTVDWPTNSVPLYADAISNYNIAAIFSGHTHHNQRYQFGTITNYVTGSAGEFGKFSVVMIDNTNIVFRSLNATMTNPILYTWTNTITPPIEPVFMASTDKKTGQSVSVTGTLNTAATTINWSNSLNGTSGKIPASVNWTITNIPLQIGENQLVFSAMSSDREPLISELSVPTRSINWFAVSDTHFNPPVGREYLFPYNPAVIRAINNLAGKAYPNASWGTVPTPRGVTHTGDCTDGGSAGSWAAFNDAYGVNGFGMVPYPVYEGYGNHDTYRADPATDAPVNISLRNAMRRNIWISSNGYHYSWDWEDVHFIQLNLYAGTSTGTGIYKAYCQNSLDFLREDLQKRVGQSGRPVVILQHFGFDSYSTNYWSDAERNSLYNCISNYNVAAFIHGHNHNPQTNNFRGISSFSLPSAGAAGMVSSFQITDTSLRWAWYNAVNSNWSGSTSISISPPQEPRIQIETLSPVINDWITLTGNCNVPLRQLAWTNLTHGQSGVISGTADWILSGIPIPKGNNTLRISALNWSNEVVISTDIMVTNTATTVKLRLDQADPRQIAWDSWSGVDGYLVDITTNANFDSSADFLPGYQQRLTTSSGVMPTGLVPNVTYYIRVSGTNSATGENFLLANSRFMISNGEYPGDPSAFELQVAVQDGFRQIRLPQSPAFIYSLEYCTNLVSSEWTPLSGQTNLLCTESPTMEISLEHDIAPSTYYRAKAVGF